MSRTNEVLVTVPCTVCGQPLLCSYDPADGVLEVSDRLGACPCSYTEAQYDELLRRAARATRAAQTEPG
mgnify:CR=1 FL=1